MLYASYQSLDDLIGPFRRLARGMLSMPRWAPSPGFELVGRWFAAGQEMLSRFELNHRRPDFGLVSVRVGGVETAVREQVILDLPFGKLLRFAKDTDVAQPRILVVAPLSGHFATLLRGTVETLLADHDVYITDWVNARDVPVEAGRFGVEDYVDYVIKFLETIGPGGHLLAVCQPCVQALVAVAVMSEDRNPATPLSMTLMAGPIDPRESPTEVNELALKKSLAWFEDSLISHVPSCHPGRGRRVYPGFVQLAAFMNMNLDRHRAAHLKLYEHLAAGKHDEAQLIKTFYDEYFSVLDLTEEFYIETVDRIFQRADLADGNFMFRGRRVDPAAIQRTALLTVEGGRDDICGLGQTAAAHDLCQSLRPHLKRHHLQANAGHYGVFNGKRWQREIYPVVRNLILAME
jgi:polyhydroxyalkanoate depolymerase